MNIEDVARAWGVPQDRLERVWVDMARDLSEGSLDELHRRCGLLGERTHVIVVGEGLGEEGGPGVVVVASVEEALLSVSQSTHAVIAHRSRLSPQIKSLLDKRGILTICYPRTESCFASAEDADAAIHMAFSLAAPV